MISPLLALAVVLGMAGAVLVACRSARARTAEFGVWMCGNVLWVAYGFWSGNEYVTVMFTFYTVGMGIIPSDISRRPERTDWVS